MMNINDDLLAMMSDTELGYIAVSGSLSFNCIFSEDYYEIQNGAGGVESTAPAIIARELDVSGLARGDIVSVNNKQFTIKSIQPDGTGMITFLLEIV